MYRNCAENVENYVKKIIEESTSALDLPQTHRRMLGVFKEKTRGSNYREDRRKFRYALHFPNPKDKAKPSASRRL